MYLDRQLFGLLLVACIVNTSCSSIYTTFGRDHYSSAVEEKAQITHVVIPEPDHDGNEYEEELLPIVNQDSQLVEPRRGSGSKSVEVTPLDNFASILHNLLVQSFLREGFDVRLNPVSMGGFVKNVIEEEREFSPSQESDDQKTAGEELLVDSMNFHMVSDSFTGRFIGGKAVCNSLRLTIMDTEDMSVTAQASFSGREYCRVVTVKLVEEISEKLRSKQQ